jgi:RNA polymerase sigma factor (TIGR02999 family)
MIILHPKIERDEGFYGLSISRSLNPYLPQDAAVMQDLSLVRRFRNRRWLMVSPKNVTQLLADWGSGDKAALEKLLPQVYQELHRLAAYYLRRERQGHTRQATALINEAYLKIIDQRSVNWQNRAHFFGVAAQWMRRILDDQARSHRYAKRGGGAQKITISDALALPQQERDLDFVALDDALKTLEQIDPKQGRIVELRFFGGLTIEETAEVLGISPATVKRVWKWAKAWQYNEMKK